MSAIVLYDSWYGNTEKIAQAIAGALDVRVQLCKVAYATHLDFEGIELLVIGSPTHGGVGAPVMNEYLHSLPEDALQDVPVAVFDTRVGMRWVKLLGFAAKRLGRAAEQKGGTLIAEPMGFYVDGKEGPLRHGELDRAAAWAKELNSRLIPRQPEVLQKAM